MSTHKKIDIICVVIMICSLLLTVIFMNGEKLGITRIVDEDSEQYSDSVYFTANDQNGDWDSSDATVITLNGDSAKISGTGAYAYDGSVYITSAGWYVVSGTLEHGKIVVDAYSSSKVWIRLNGVDISSEDDACIRVEQADKVFLTLSENTENKLYSGKNYSDEALAEGVDGAIFARDDITINGSGSLTITAEYKHGIAANDDLVITGGNITVMAAKDAIHANDSIRIREAAIAVTAADDGIVTAKGGSYLYIESGTVDITSEDDGIHTAGDVTIAGGELTISAGDDGIHSDTDVTILDGVTLVKECYEGIEALTIHVAGGDITIYSSDDGFNANGGGGDAFGGMGGGMGQNMGGMGGRGGLWDRNSGSDTASGSDGNSETDTRQNTGGMPDMGNTTSMNGMPDMENMTGMNGMPDMGNMTSMNGMPDMGNTTGMNTNAADASDSTEETYIEITGGNITIINETAQDADGLDSNGDIFISGGSIRISLVNSGSNSALDYGSENGGVCEISGGNIIACGSYSMAEGFDSSSTQCSILYNVSSGIAAGTTVALEDADGNMLISYEVPCTFSSVVISCPEMVLGESYLMVIGDDVEEITLDEVAASFGNAQSTMFGGSMNWGGMQDRESFGGMRGRGGRDQSDSTVSGADGNGMPDMSQMGTPPDMGGVSGADGNGMPDMSQMGTPPDMGGVSGTDGNGMPDMSQMGTPPDMGGVSGTDGNGMPDMSQMGTPPDMTGGQAGANDESAVHTESTEEEYTKSYTVTKEDIIWLGASVLMLAAGIIVAKAYKRHF